MKCVAIPLNEIVKVDLVNFEVKYNKDFKLFECVDKVFKFFCICLLL